MNGRSDLSVIAPKLLFIDQMITVNRRVFERLNFSARPANFDLPDRSRISQADENSRVIRRQITARIACVEKSFSAVCIRYNDSRSFAVLRAFFGA